MEPNPGPKLPCSSSRTERCHVCAVHYSNQALWSVESRSFLQRRNPTPKWHADRAELGWLGFHTHRVVQSAMQRNYCCFSITTGESAGRSLFALMERRRNQRACQPIYTTKSESNCVCEVNISYICIH